MTYKKLKPGKCNIYNAPNIDRVICGVDTVCQLRDGSIVIRYEDHTHEVRPCSDDLMNDDKFPSGLFSIVEFVQAGRVDGSALFVTHEDAQKMASK